MKKIEAIIRPEKLEAVRNTLESSGYPGIMLTEVQGHGKQKGFTQQWRGEEYRVDLLPKIKLEIVVNDEDVKRIIDAIISCAKTGQVGDGKIFVYDVVEAIRIRTRESGKVAV
ncbi:MAG: transcriptional regulator [Omnitrophica bacterium RIFCSPLOWO2_01_FULL_50_24]|nr:MAG: transcriptional regulator [Omnitrophica bacterium RIFCSPLOWO2_01_FULL_50_24]